MVVAALAVAATGTLAVAGDGAGAAPAKRCGTAPFTGTISRTDDGQQPGAEADGVTIESATVFDFGGRTNFTVYLAQHRLDPDDLGSTIVAPPGEVLATVFLGAKNGRALRAGQRLRVGRDPITVIVDAGAGAVAVTGDAQGTVRVQRVTKRLVCFTLDYEDRYQRIDGTVRARIPE